MARAVAPGGVVIFETFTAAHAERTGFRREYCLDPGELLRELSGFHVLAYREHEVDGAELAGIVARR